MRTIVAAVIFLASAGSASAQSLKLEFNDGRVSIDASSVPVRTILSEWARLGGTKVVGGERVTGPPLTIKLESVPEAQALEVVLRNVAGYMAAPKRADATGASAYDRILVMPTSSAPANAPAAASIPSGGGLGGRSVRGPFGAAQPADSEPVEPPVPDPADTGVNEPPFSFPQQNPFQSAGQEATPFGTPMAPGQPPVINFGQGAQQGTQNGVTINPVPEQPMPVLQFPGMPPQGAPPTGGFGIVGAPTPGVVVQPAVPVQPGQPGQPTRPPGGNR